MGTIGERIRELRGKLSREAFAAKYTIHRNTVERYEKNLRSPDTLFLQELARQENVNLEWVQTGAEPKYKVFVWFITLPFLAPFHGSV